MSTRSRSLLVAVSAIVFVALLALAGCGAQQAEAPEEPQAAAEETTEQQPAEEAEPEVEVGGLYTPEYQPNGKEVAVIKTSKGDVTMELFGKDAPLHVGNFVELAKKGFYDGTKFHRYVEGFVVQGGDPDTKDASADEVKAEAAKGDGGGRFGLGGPGYRIKGEFATNPHKHEKGAVGMARSMDPDSAGSQFYFALEPLTQLDGSYTVFGKVTKGMDVVESLRAGDVIESVEIRGAVR